MDKKYSEFFWFKENEVVKALQNYDVEYKLLHGTMTISLKIVNFIILGVYCSAVKRAGSILGGDFWEFFDKESVKRYKFRCKRLVGKTV